MLATRSHYRLLLLHWCLIIFGTAVAIQTPLSASPSNIEGTDGLRLQEIIDRAVPYEKLFVEPGRYRGPVLINKPLTLESTGAAIIDGGGQGRVVTIDAPNVTIRGFIIQNSGRRLDIEDSGVFVTPEGHNATVENNRILNNLIGVYLKGPTDAKVIANRIEGDRTLRVNERGNGVQLWRTPGSIVSGNNISWGRDGIFVTTSKKNKFSDNHIHNVRFAVHYMYTNESEVSDNLSENNHLGYAIMYARKIRIVGN
ncbi:MAG: NosD domain-containing protein, partial [Methyloligellaceae bacterium]